MSEVVEVVWEIADFVLDPFVGIGSTVIAAYKLGMKSIGIDSDRNYIRVAENNINELAK